MQSASSFGVLRRRQWVNNLRTNEITRVWRIQHTRVGYF